MSTISIRLSKKERQDLLRYGRISEVVKEALRLYLNDKRSRRAVKRLRELQRRLRLRTAVEDDLRLIREERKR